MRTRMNANRARRLLLQWESGDHVHRSSMKVLIRMGLMVDNGDRYAMTPIAKRFCRAFDSAPFGVELPAEVAP